MQDTARARPRYIAFSALLALVMLTASCGTASGGEVASADVPRATTDGVPPTAAVDAVNQLAVDLYTRLAGEPGNLIFSPYSVEIALAMARHGARGETRAQMDAVLRATAGLALDDGFNALAQALASRPGHKGDDMRNGDVELSTANALFGQRDTTFEQLFLEVLARYYGSGLRLVDYRVAADHARREINEWVEDQTKDRIVDLLPEGSLDAMTRLVLTNALYFKAPWAKRFGPIDGFSFTNAEGAVGSVPGMAVSKVGRYREGDGWRSGEMPYLGEELSMVVIVPDDLASFESSLDRERLERALRGPSRDLTSLQMPKFEFRTEVQLKSVLSVLGMPLAFDPERADFSAITTQEPLVISDVFHQGFIAVDEEGTEAAAATAVVFEAVSGAVGADLVVDRPFLFAIRDIPTGAILFLGRVTDPTVA
jgi:serpin B